MHREEGIVKILHLCKVRFDRRTSAITQQWLEARYKFFTRYTLRSLLWQTAKNLRAYCGLHKWLLWINCDSGMREMVGSLREILAEIDCPVWFSFGDDSPCPADMPNRGWFEQLRTADYVYVTRIDSDDVFSRDALSLATSVQPHKVGDVEASIFKRGYLHELPTADYPTGRLGVYHNPSSPFHTIMYPREVFVDPEAYQQVFQRTGDHSMVAGSGIHCHGLPDWKFCVLIHGGEGGNFLSDFDYSRERATPNSTTHWVERGWTLDRFMGCPVVFDVDDFADEWGGVKGTDVLAQLDQLRARYPSFRCTLFTIPMHASADLLRRARVRRWVEVAVHGISHKPNQELQSVSPHTLVRKLFSIDYTDSNPIGPYTRGFRPPGWYITAEHIQACQKLEKPPWVALNEKDRHTLAPLCTQGYYVCGERLPYWHGHTHNVCGNWLQQHLPELLERWHPLQHFSFVSDAVLIPPLAGNIAPPPPVRTNYPYHPAGDL